MYYLDSPYLDFLDKKCEDLGGIRTRGLQYKDLQLYINPLSIRHIVQQKSLKQLE